MRKNLFLLIILLLPLNINAATTSSSVGYDMSLYKCTNEFQDRNISSSGIAYFSHCIEATCNNREYNFEYYSNEKVNCLNGNKDPYYELYKTGCNVYQNKTCDNNSVKYCSMIMKYDCSKKKDGSSFITTTTTKKTTTKKRTTTKKTTIKTTTTTTEKIIINTKLKTLRLSHGNILFNKDLYDYEITINEDVNNIEITAVAEDSNNSINITGNSNLVNGSIISITVTGKDGSSTIYKIKVKKEIKLSSNNNLKSLVIEDYDLKFNPNEKTYFLTIDSSINSLNINYELEDEKSTVVINNNENLVNGSKIIISVTAEDGSLNQYNIQINKKQKSNTLTILFIIILILSLIAGGYYIYIRFIKSKGAEKYEYE